MYTCIAIRPKYFVFLMTPYCFFQRCIFSEYLPLSRLIRHQFIHSRTANQADDGDSVGHTHDVQSKTQTFSVFFAASSQKSTTTNFLIRLQKVLHPLLETYDVTWF